jgi:uncharacterized protein (TIGR02118 family)
MFQITVLYAQPADTAAFEKHYADVHAPLAAKIPGLQRYTVSYPVPGPDGATPAYYLVAVLEFADGAAAAAGMGGPEGQAAAADLANFAQAGVTILQGPSDIVV